MELVITLAVLAIVIGIAVPSFNAMMHRNRIAAAANEMVGALQTARMEAVRRNRRVTVCPTTDGSACAGSNWSRVVIRSAAGPIREFEPVRSSSGISTSTRGASGSAVTLTSIEYSASGRASASAALPVKLEFVSSKLPSTENKRLVQIESSRVGVCRGATATTSCP